MSYWGRDLPNPEEISRSPRSLLSVSHRSGEEKQERFATAAAAPGIGDTMTQSLPSAQSLYNRYPSGQFGLSHPDDKNSTLTVSQSLSPLAELGGMNRARTGTSEDSRYVPSRPHASGSRPTVMYSRSAGSKSFGASGRDTMQCLRCGARFPITNLDGYEKHIRDCYSDVQ